MEVIQEQASETLSQASKQILPWLKPMFDLKKFVINTAQTVTNRVNAHFMHM